MNNQTTEPSTPAFESAMQELETIVATLESGKVSLGESLQLVKRGRELSELCARLLGEAELALSQLADSPAGELVEQELEWNDEAA
jgi:exodeoxyribonuclease VII small subunit